MSRGAYYTGEYRNRFAELGISEKEIEDRKNQIFQTLFYGADDEKIYTEVGTDMAYIQDTGNIDARTEGMSYGMMFCVQMDKQQEFDRLWKWAKTYMFLEIGPNKGYFAWSCGLDGEKNSFGAAPDGEEYFAMALIMAHHRWGSREGIFNYEQQALSLLHDCIHKGEPGTEGRAMWDPDNHLIRFIAECDYTDPSYQLPHFYTLYAMAMQDDADRDFFNKAKEASRAYLPKACHAETGLSPEYSYYDGTPYKEEIEIRGDHSHYFSDAYRTIANIALDYSWFAADEWELEEEKRFLNFWTHGNGADHWDGIFEIDGTQVEGTALHPVAIIATNAEAALNVDSPEAEQVIRKFWDTPLRTGKRRYYDNCLYFFAFLALSGNYRIY